MFPFFRWNKNWSMKFGQNCEFWHVLLPKTNMYLSRVLLIVKSAKPGRSLLSLAMEQMMDQPWRKQMLDLLWWVLEMFCSKLYYRLTFCFTILLRQICLGTCKTFVYPSHFLDLIFFQNIVLPFRLFFLLDSPFLIRVLVYYRGFCIAAVSVSLLFSSTTPNWFS